MMLTVLLYATLALAALLLLRSVQNWARSKGHPLPPGPRGLPFVGNILDGPSQPSWITYNQWSKIYDSPLVRFSILGKNIIICNTLKSATDLLDKRSAIYSSRPHLTMLVDLCGFVWTFGLQHYGQQWRTQRKLFHSQFNSQMVPRLRPIEEKTTLRFLYHLLETPEEFMQHTRLLVGAQVIEMTYGFRVQDYNNPYITAAEEALACVEKALTAGAYMVDFFPLLKHVPAWLPGAGFQRQAREWKKSILRMKEMAYANRLKQLTRLGADEGNDCLMNRLLKNLQKYDAAAAPYTEEDIKDVLGTAYAAGTDTVVAAMQFFMLAMVLYPEAQKKAQAEIDSVCADRLPEFDDMDAMPYIEAVARETLRWHPVGPEAIPHASTEDDVYEGYFIPKGSILVANTWAILHDETRYPAPFVFNPDRFIKDGELNPDVMKPDVTAFGFGRRVCPGRFMARESLWIMIARTLAVYDILPKKDAAGCPMMPTEEMNHGAVCDPKPFKCDIVPRSARHRDMMLSALRMSEAA